MTMMLNDVNNYNKTIFVEHCVSHTCDKKKKKKN